MWSKVAEEMAIPWRAAEAMHWQLGEHDIARRAGVTPFSVHSSSTTTTTAVEAPLKSLRGSKWKSESQLPSLAELGLTTGSFALPANQTEEMSP